MQTLHDNMMATKTVEYLMSGAFLLLFPAFWWFISKRPAGARRPGVTAGSARGAAQSRRR
jgi:hypothetical protein